jgi:hypothetical protein
MKISNVRLGFATNSSSAHSIIILKPGYSVKNDDGGRWGEYSYQWENFTLSDATEKVKYIAANLFLNLREEGLAVAEAVVIVRDLLGVNFEENGLVVDEQVTNNSDNVEVSVDHQSVIYFPPKHLDFWKELADYVSQDQIVILGGNDGGERTDITAPHSKLNWLNRLQLDTRVANHNLQVRKDSKHWVVFNNNSGAKIRFSFTNEDYTKASAPELVDLKITDYCPMGCEFCYQASTKKGLHADTKQIEKILDQLSELGVFEVAIGGGEPTMHPDFAHILEYARKCNITPNFTTYSTAWLKKKQIVSAVAEYVGAIGVSVHNTSDLEKVFKIQNAFKNLRTRRYGLVMAQHVLGVQSMVDTAELIAKCSERYLPLLLLGYKNVGFGANLIPHDFTDFPMVLKLALDTPNYHTISVDTAVLNQHPNLLKVLEVSEVLATKEEGKFSCYIDAVKLTIGQSSYCTTMTILPETSEEIQKLFLQF